jgi:hypothetical protein
MLSGAGEVSQDAAGSRRADIRLPRHLSPKQARSADGLWVFYEARVVLCKRSSDPTALTALIIWRIERDRG